METYIIKYVYVIGRKEGKKEGKLIAVLKIETCGLFLEYVFLIFSDFYSRISNFKLDSDLRF